MKREEAGKMAFICFRQLEEMIRVVESYGNKTSEYETLGNSVRNYNGVLNKLKQCFSIDASFSEAIQGLSEIPTDIRNLGGIEFGEC